MGIDVYLDWKGRSEEEQKAQYTGFRIDAGNVGYLREAYHGGPYATQVLIPEGWDDDLNEKHEGNVPIPAATLRERLPNTVLTTIIRHHMIYGHEEDPSTIDAENANSLREAVAKALAETQDRSAKDLVQLLTDADRQKVSELIANRALPDWALAFVDFVELAERKERETGELCRIHVSA